MDLQWLIKGVAAQGRHRSSRVVGPPLENLVRVRSRS
jgi:hypothetical protein